VVTTFVQLLESIFTNRNRAIRKFHNLAHAVVVLDEVQAIPPKYFNAIEAAFRCFSEYFGTKFIFVTATQPTLFTSSSDIVELTDPGKIKTRQYFEQMNRITLDQSLLSRTKYAEMDFEEVKSFVWEDIQNNSELSFLVICNTIRQSQEMYQFLKAKVGSAYPIRYLSSSIIPYCRKQIISEVKAHKGPQILVSTQVVEAGVDIDFDVVWRDWAPLDSINQSAGRCNRNGVKGKGRVKLFHAGKARHIYGSQLLSATESVLKKEAFGEVIPEAQFYTLNTDYAAAVWKAVADDNSKSKKIIEAMKHLNLETLNAAFKLIDDACLSYNVFIPINQQAMEVWSRYMENCKIEDRFERKTAMKLLRPELMPFVTKFPKNRYDPPEGQKDNYIIFTPYWEENYDLALGFVHDNLEDKYI
jgi:CRISPR-associated endonuclease/helicase Cas3